MSQAPSRRALIYVASVDLTAATGPAVNEREALLALRRLLGPDLFVIVGRPRASHPDIDAIRPDRLLPWDDGRKPMAVLAHQAAKARILRREVRRLRPSCVVARLDAMPLGLLLGTVGLPVRIVVKSLGGPTLHLDPATHGRIPAMLNRLLARAVARKVTAADTITRQRRPIIARELGIPESRVAAIDNGVNVQRFYPIEPAIARERCGLDPEAVVFGYAGTHVWVRGGLHLVDAAARLKEAFARPRIAIVGGGEDVARLEAHAKANGHDDICVFPGLVPYEDVIWWMNCFDVAISIEPGEIARREGHSQQKVRQYTAVGVPVVSAICGNEYLEEQNIGSLVDPDDPGAIEEALIRWGKLGDVERANVRERARGFAEASLTVEALNEARVRFWRESGCVGEGSWQRP